MKRSVVFLIVMLMVAVFAGDVLAQITINGDARVRPRLDTITSYNADQDDNITSSDIYYMYWVRLWVKADIDNGWYADVMIGADGPANWIGKFGTNQNYDRGDDIGWDRNENGILRFNRIEFGRKTDQFGYSGGLLYFNSLANPLYDLHWYPGSRSDVPYLIVDNSTHHGFRGFYNTGNGTLNAAITVDTNAGRSDGIDETDDPKDQYSVHLEYKTKFGDLGVAPSFVYTLGDKDMGAATPMSLGANVNLPKFGETALSLGAYYTSQPEEDPGKYTGFMAHAKVVSPVGPGTIISWLDYSSVDYDEADDTLNTMYLWLMYRIMIHKSDMGNVSINPTFRRIQQTFGDDERFDFSRNKIELTMQMVFK